MIGVITQTADELDDAEEREKTRGMRCQISPSSVEEPLECHGATRVLRGRVWHAARCTLHSARRFVLREAVCTARPGSGLAAYGSTDVPSAGKICEPLGGCFMSLMDRAGHFVKQTKFICHLHI